MAVAHCYARSLEDVERARIEKAVAVINAVYGAPDRLRALAEDVVAHWVNRSAQMVKVMGTPGKALIVGGTREICAGGWSPAGLLDMRFGDTNRRLRSNTLGPISIAAVCAGQQG